MSKSGGGFGIGTIIFLIVLYHVIFDNDDEKEVKIVDQVKDVIIETKEFIVETAESEQVQNLIETAKEKLTKDKDEEEIEVAETIEEEKSNASAPEIISPEPEEQQPKTDEFEKL